MKMAVMASTAFHKTLCFSL